MGLRVRLVLLGLRRLLLVPRVRQVRLVRLGLRERLVLTERQVRQDRLVLQVLRVLRVLLARSVWMELLDRPGQLVRLVRRVRLLR